MRKAMAGVVLALTLTAGAAQAADSPLAGTWTLTAADRITPAGVREHDYGAAPKGRLIVDAAGRYSLQIYKAERTGFASGDKKKGTPDEYAAAILGLSTHTGRITVDPAAHNLKFEIENAAYLNWEHTTQVREYTLTGDELFYQVPATAGAGTAAASLWRRVGN